MKSAYYNEIDPQAAAWLKELIHKGHIAPGDVDTRSIEDVHPDDLKNYTQCHFFAGIGVWSYALRQAGWSDDRPIWTGSCPCQPFSAAGKGSGFDDERHLWPAFNHLIQVCRPPIVLGEQVASKDGLAWIDLVQTDLEIQGYATAAVDLCAAGFGAPNIRQRLYWMGHTDDARSQGHGRSVQEPLPEGRQGTERHGASPSGLSELADAARQFHDGRRSSRASGRSEYTDRSATGSVADTNGGQRDRLAVSEGRITNWSPSGRVESNRVTSTSGELFQLANSQSSGRSQVGSDAGGKPAGDSSEGQSAGLGAGCGDSGACATNGFWRDADWLLCRDGKLRPVEPGTQPLADGSPARVGRLRGYGNAINAEVAKGFVEVVKEIVDEGR